MKKEEEQKKKLHFADEKKKEELPRTDNPYARKEVSYVCEVGGDLAVVVGGVFRRVREARELGESHGRGVEARLGEFGSLVILLNSFEEGRQSMEPDALGRM